MNSMARCSATATDDFITTVPAKCLMGSTMTNARPPVQGGRLPSELHGFSIPRNANPFLDPMLLDEIPQLLSAQSHVIDGLALSVQ